MPRLRYVFMAISLCCGLLMSAYLAQHYNSASAIFELSNATELESVLLDAEQYRRQTVIYHTRVNRLDVAMLSGRLSDHRTVAPIGGKSDIVDEAHCLIGNKMATAYFGDAPRVGGTIGALGRKYIVRGVIQDAAVDIYLPYSKALLREYPWSMQTIVAFSDGDRSNLQRVQSLYGARQIGVQSTLRHRDYTAFFWSCSLLFTAIILLYSAYQKIKESYYLIAPVFRARRQRKYGFVLQDYLNANRNWRRDIIKCAIAIIALLGGAAFAAVHIEIAGILVPTNFLSPFAYGRVILNLIEAFNSGMAGGFYAIQVAFIKLLAIYILIHIAALHALLLKNRSI